MKDNEIKARVVAAMHQARIYDPATVQIDEAADFLLLTGERGRLKHLIKAMALENQSPVELKTFPVAADLITLNAEQAAVAEYIAIHDETALPEDLR